MIVVMTGPDDPARSRLLRRGFTLEYLTLGWNAAGIAVLAVAAVAARSVAVAGYVLVYYAAREVREVFFPAGH